MNEGANKTTSVDEWRPGLRFSVKALNIKTVKRADTPDDVLPVCLAHNLRQGNHEHRHRSRIDSTRSCLNEVWAGPDRLEVATSLVRDTLESMDITPRRRDAIMGVEMVFQPPHGINLRPFWSACLTWAQARYEHIVSSIVHHDQKRPHMHILALAVCGGRLAGNEMTAHPNRPKQRRADFMAYMRETLGLRPDRKVKTLGDIAASPGKGPKNRAEANRSNAEFIKTKTERRAPSSLGLGVHGLGGLTAAVSNPHSPQPPVIAHLSHHDKVRLLWALVADLKVTPASPLQPQPQPPKAATQDAPVIRVRDDEMSSEWWDAEAGEFKPSNEPKKQQKTAAQAWVEAALQTINGEAPSLPREQTQN